MTTDLDLKRKWIFCGEPTHGIPSHLEVSPDAGDDQYMIKPNGRFEGTPDELAQHIKSTLPQVTTVELIFEEPDIIPGFPKQVFDALAPFFDVELNELYL